MILNFSQLLMSILIKKLNRENCKIMRSYRLKLYKCCFSREEMMNNPYVKISIGNKKEQKYS